MVNYSEIPQYAAGTIAQVGAVITASNTPSRVVGTAIEFVVADGAPAGRPDKISNDGYVSDGYVPCSALQSAPQMFVTQGDVAVTDGYVPPALPQCSDRLDNDGDGRFDYPDDRGCASVFDESEDTPTPACWDGVDNDGDGLGDYPYDPGCDSASDDDEFNPPPAPSSKSDCDRSGYATYGFKNQGECLRAVKDKSPKPPKP